jgi:hypothetical protein
MEQFSIEKKNILNKLDQYVSNEAQEQEIHKMEEGIFSMLLALGAVFLKEALAKKGTGKTEKIVQNKDKKEVPFYRIKEMFYQSIFGKISIFKAYFWEYGKNGICPLNQELNLPENNRSYLLDKWIQAGITDQAYHKAIANITELLRITVSKKAEEEMSRKASKNTMKYYKEEATLLEKEGATIIVSADCKGVAMISKERPDKPKEVVVRRGKGSKKKGLRKDAVVTTDYSINPDPRTPEDVIESLMNVNSDKKPINNKKKKNKERPKNKIVVATMNGKEQAFQDLADRIKARDPTEQIPLFLLIDGERALETGLVKELKQRKWKKRIKGICLDIIHAVEYLWEAGTVLYGEKNPKRTTWVRKKLLEILNDKVGYVIGSLRQHVNKRKSLSPSKTKILEKVIRYFDNHKHMMCYKKYLEEGLPIATGVIEGACGSLVKNRMDCAGMKWTKEGANAVLGLRGIKQNGYWESYWEYFIQEEKKRLYEN